MTDPRPLWEVMEESTGTVAEWGDMIRAVADWIENRQVTDYAVTLPDVREVIGWLRAEAARAERGETINPSENV
jgi:hypothetical protein